MVELGAKPRNGLLGASRGCQRLTMREDGIYKGKSAEGSRLFGFAGHKEHFLSGQWELNQRGKTRMHRRE